MTQEQGRDDLRRAEQVARAALERGEPIPPEAADVLARAGSPLASATPLASGERADPDAVAAAASGEAPPPAPGAAGESAPGEPSRAEVMALNPEAAEAEGTLPGTPTSPEAGQPGQADSEPRARTEPEQRMAEHEREEE